MKRLMYLDGKTYDLAGPSGNAFAILGTLKRWFRQGGVSSDDVKQFMDEAMSGDYDHLLKTVREATGIEFVNGEWDTE